MKHHITRDIWFAPLFTHNNESCRSTHISGSFLHLILNRARNIRYAETLSEISKKLF